MENIPDQNEDLSKPRLNMLPLSYRYVTINTFQLTNMFLPHLTLICWCHIINTIWYCCIKIIFTILLLLSIHIIDIVIIAYPSSPMHLKMISISLFLPSLLILTLKYLLLHFLFLCVWLGVYSFLLKYVIYIHEQLWPWSLNCNNQKPTLERQNKSIVYMIHWSLMWPYSVRHFMTALCGRNKPFLL